MNTMHVDRPKIITGINSSKDARVLETIGMDGVALALWLRDPVPGRQAWLDSMPAVCLPRYTGVATVSDVDHMVTEACNQCGTPRSIYRDQLVEDVAGLARIASRAFSCLMIKLRLEVTDTLRCPRWHLDAVPARMLYTLRGPGTEFGVMGLGEGPSEVSQLPAGSVGIFRGSLWPGPELSAIVHRSPPATNGKPRLTLAIDPVVEAGTC